MWSNCSLWEVHCDVAKVHMLCTYQCEASRYTRRFLRQFWLSEYLPTPPHSHHCKKPLLITCMVSQTLSESPVWSVRPLSESPVWSVRPLSESPVWSVRPLSESPVWSVRPPVRIPCMVSQTRSESPVWSVRPLSESPVWSVRPLSESP